MNIHQQEAAARLAYQLAAVDMTRAIRDLVAAAQRVAMAATAWDPTGNKQDPGVLVLLEACGIMLAAACASSPGMHALFASAVARTASAPATPPGEEQR